MFDKLAKDLIEKAAIEINKNENKILIENKIIAPLFEILKNKINKYILIMLGLYLLNIILIIFIIHTLYK